VGDHVVQVAGQAVAFLLCTELAETSATHLLQEVVDRVDELPESERPEIVVHGQSLGEVAGMAALGWGLFADPVAAVGVLADLPGSESAAAGTLHSYQPVLPPDGCTDGVGQEGTGTLRILNGR